MTTSTLPLDILVRKEIRSLLDGNSPNGLKPQDCGQWSNIILKLHEAHYIGGTNGVSVTWKFETQKDPTLTNLLASSPMDGATETARKILNLEPKEKLPNIDEATKLVDLADFVNTVMVIQNSEADKPRVLMRNRKLAISHVVCRLLSENKRLILDISEDSKTGIPYLIGDDKAIWALNTELLPVKVLLAETGLNPSEPTFDWIINDLEKITFEDAPKIKLARYWVQKDDALYISAGPTKMIKTVINSSDSPELTSLDNGAENVYFASDATLPAWQVYPPKSPLTLTAFNPPLITSNIAKGYTPDVQKLLLQAWLVALIAGIRPLLILVATGNCDGGKTTLIKGILQLLLNSEPTTPSEDARDLWTSAINSPLLGLDNVDGDHAYWLSDFLASLTTGTLYKRRKMRTNADEDIRKPQAIALISTRTGTCVSRPDVAQRTLPILAGEFNPSAKKRKADSELAKEIEENRNAVLTWLASEAIKMLQKIKQAPNDDISDIRFVDFARVVWAFDEQNANQAIQALQQAQSQVVGEKDEFLNAIIEHIDELLNLQNPPNQQWEDFPSQLPKDLSKIGAQIPWQGGGKAIAQKLREGKSTLALFGINLKETPYGNGSKFTFTKQP